MAYAGSVRKDFEMVCAGFEQKGFEMAHAGFEQMQLLVGCQKMFHKTALLECTHFHNSQDNFGTDLNTSVQKHTHDLTVHMTLQYT